MFLGWNRSQLWNDCIHQGPNDVGTCQGQANAAIIVVTSEGGGARYRHQHHSASVSVK